MSKKSIVLFAVSPNTANVRLTVGAGVWTHSKNKASPGLFNNDMQLLPPNNFASATSGGVDVYAGVIEADPANVSVRVTYTDGSEDSVIPAVYHHDATANVAAAGADRTSNLLFAALGAALATLGS